MEVTDIGDSVRCLNPNIKTPECSMNTPVKRIISYFD